MTAHLFLADAAKIFLNYSPQIFACGPLLRWKYWRKSDSTFQALGIVVYLEYTIFRYIYVYLYLQKAHWQQLHACFTQNLREIIVLFQRIVLFSLHHLPVLLPFVLLKIQQPLSFRMAHCYYNTERTAPGSVTHMADSNINNIQ